MVAWNGTMIATWAAILLAIGTGVIIFVNVAFPFSLAMSLERSGK
jgi:hypothetical protein